MRAEAALTKSEPLLGRPSSPPGGMPQMPLPPPEIEQARLLDLRSLQLLDTASEDRFDRLTRLIADAIDIPIALVSLVDSKRQWFKSAHGIERGETSREDSFCAHAILEPELLIVPDASVDPRFASNPLVLGDPRIRFYAGAVLRGPAGQAVGTCCIIDRKPRQLTAQEKGLLRQVAALTERELHQTHHLADLRSEIEREVFQDAETGLPNERLFTDRVTQEIERAAAKSGHITVLSVNFMNIGAVKALSGSASDGALLIEAARRITGIVGGSGATTARRGHQLAVLLPGGPQDEGETVRLIAKALAEPFEIGRETHHPGAVVGASVFPEDGGSAEALIAASEAALAADASTTEARCRYYNPAIGAAIASRHDLENRLRRALRDEALHLAYQPKVDARSGAVCGAEALLRWTDPERGAISPLDIVGVAERSELIHELGAWVLRRVCRQIRSWHDRGLRIGPIAANLSGAELLSPELRSRVQSAIREAGIPPGSLELEITESTLIADLAVAAKRIKELAEAGIAFAIDDFGTGYSSLAYLKRLPVKYLKIDRAFVRDIAVSADDAAVARGIIDIARSLRLMVIAEGVETSAQATQLRASGCDQFQGYFFARPLLPHEFEAWLLRSKPRPLSLESGMPASLHLQ
jgi:diguanylate cyclase